MPGLPTSWAMMAVFRKTPVPITVPTTRAVVSASVRLRTSPVSSRGMEKARQSTPRHRFRRSLTGPATVRVNSSERPRPFRGLLQARNDGPASRRCKPSFAGHSLKGPRTAGPRRRPRPPLARRSPAARPSPALAPCSPQPLAHCSASDHPPLGRCSPPARIAAGPVLPHGPPAAGPVLTLGRSPATSRRHFDSPRGELFTRSSGWVSGRAPSTPSDVVRPNTRSVS